MRLGAARSTRASNSRAGRVRSSSNCRYSAGFQSLVVTLIAGSRQRTCAHGRTRPDSLQQVLDAVLLALQLGQRDVDAFLAEGVDRQAFDQLVFAVLAGHREAEHRVLRDAVLAVR